MIQDLLEQAQGECQSFSVRTMLGYCLGANALFLSLH